MYPFNLELAQQGYPLKTRDGKKVVFIGMAPNFYQTNTPVIVWIEGDKYPTYLTPQGRVWATQGECGNDVFMEDPVKKYLVSWKTPTEPILLRLLETKEARDNYIRFLPKDAEIVFSKEIFWFER